MFDSAGEGDLALVAVVEPDHDGEVSLSLSLCLSVRLSVCVTALPELQVSARSGEGAGV